MTRELSVKDWSLVSFLIGVTGGTLMRVVDSTFLCFIIAIGLGLVYGFVIKSIDEMERKK